MAHLRKTMRLLRALAVPVILILLWEGLSRAHIINPIILPPYYYVGRLP